MSRVYDNAVLQTVAVKSLTISFKWNPKEFQNGHGTILECTISGVRRFCLADSSGIRSRYYVFCAKIKRAHRRQFNSSGREIEPNFSETQKVSTGYLPSSYRTDAKGQTDRLTTDETSTLLSHCKLLDITGQPPAACLYLWIDETALDKIEIYEEDEVRVKTAGNSPFIESISKVGGQSVAVSNYAGGEKVGASWTDKIMSMKEPRAPAPDEGKNEGVDDDEWDD